MTLMYESQAYLDHPDAPGTHALIVGIGNYTYLLGGAEEVRPNRLPLAQLTSSPVSAYAVVDWMLGTNTYAGHPEAKLNNPAAPLATVDLLVSEASPAADPASIPTMANLKTAINQWVARCNTHSDNVAFLYLCGHGLKVRDLVLLTSDFGKPGELSIWNQALSLDSIRLGMRKCSAQSQFMFFDCCRSYPIAFTDVFATGNQMFDALMDHADNRNYLAMNSTLEGSQAFGTAGEPSHFTKALLEGLSGFASENRGGGWVVTNSSLASATHRIMRFDSGASVNRQLVVSEAPGDATLHVLRGLPKVKTRVQCLPPVPVIPVTYQLKRSGLVHHEAINQPLRADIEPGEWRVEMGVGGHWMQHDQMIYPPTCDHPFKYP